MQRRTFLKYAGHTLIAVPVAINTLGCSKDDPAAPSGNPPATDRFDTLSSVDLSHAHNLRLLCSDLQGGTLTYTSDDSGGHTHQIDLTVDQVNNILMGNQVTVTNSDLSHAHNWVIQKPASVCP